MGPGWLEFIAIRRVYMGLCGQGSRGRGISAIGGWQWGGVPVPVFTGAGSSREQGGRDGSPPPVFTGAGSRREANEGKGCEIPGLRCVAVGMTCG